MTSQVRRRAVVIGAGIVGLHTAHTLQEKGFEVYVLEQEPHLGEQTSGRNSGVIHAGIFYKPGSFKEKICIEGNRLTYEWLKRLDVPHQACGKWIVPEEGQDSELEPFFERIRQLPIPSPQLMSPLEVQKEEPHLRATEAILVPSTGILDAATYVKNLATYLENRTVNVILNCKALEVKVESSKAKGQSLVTTRGDIPFDIAVNSAGLFADEVATLAGLEGYEIHPCRGDYYLLNKNPIHRPVYHLPYHGADGLGVHLTPTIDNQTLLGPNAFFIDDKRDYQHRSDSSPFEKAVRYYLPKWSQSQGDSLSLHIAYSGNRPKLFRDGNLVPEFTIIQKDNWIHLLGIESPGLTAAPALANYVGKLLS